MIHFVLDCSQRRASRSPGESPPWPAGPAWTGGTGPGGARSPRASLHQHSELLSCDTACSYGKQLLQLLDLVYWQSQT